MSGKLFVGGAPLVLSLLALASIPLVAQQPETELALDEAARVFEQGKMAEAEQKLRSVLEKHPSNLQALVLQGAILDSQQRFSEADPYYQRAMKVAPGSAQLLNNLANHYLASGRPSRHVNSTSRPSPS